MIATTETGYGHNHEQPQLATLELVTTEDNEEGTSLTLALQPLTGELAVVWERCLRCRVRV